MKILNERFVSWAEAKKLLAKRQKEKELGYEQKNALEHLKKFSKLSEKTVKQMMEELKGIEKLKEKHIVAIANILPQDLDDLRVLFANEVVNLSDEDKKKILSIVKKFS